MRSLRSPLLISMMALAVSCAVRTGEPQKTSTSSGFSFVLRYGCGGAYELDTAKGRFTGIDLKLTAAELDQIEKALASMDFGNSAKFPSTSEIPDSAQRRCSARPIGQPVISVTRGRSEKTVSWDRCDRSDEARDLWALESMIDSMVREKPESRNVRQVFCR
jgi:hypothetical protein